MHQPPVPHVASTDPEVARLIDAEAQRQFEKVRLIPSENYVSLAVLEASGTVLTNKYSEGYPGRRYYEGQQVIDVIETLAIDRAKALFGVEHANVQPYSGSPANLAVYLALAAAGRHRSWAWRCRWAAISPTAGRSRSPASGSGRCSTASGPTPAALDLDEVRDLARRERPEADLLRRDGDPAHHRLPGLRRDRRRGRGGPGRRHRPHRRADRRRRAPIAGRPRPGHHHDHAQDPARPARRDDHVRRRAREAPGPGGLPRVAGRPAQPHHRGDCRGPARGRAAGVPRRTPRRWCATRRRWRIRLSERGYTLVSGGTDNHLILADLTSQGIGGKPAAQALDRAGIELNYNTVPFDKRKPFDPSGIRLGTPAITTRGLDEAHMPQIAAWMDEAITAAAKEDETTIERIAGEVREFLAAFPMPGWAAT